MQWCLKYSYLFLYPKENLISKIEIVLFDSKTFRFSFYPTLVVKKDGFA